MSAQSQAPQRWFEVAADPMDPRVVSGRRAAVDAARRDPLPGRIDRLRALARGRRVLDVGAVDHTTDNDRRQWWLHGHLAEVAAEIVGVDIVATEIERLCALGYDVRHMDLTSGDRPEGVFDLIVAGELVEHLDRPTALFEAAAELLTPDGRLVLTTPNPYACWRVFQNLRGRPVENVDHALLLSPWGLIELAERAGLVLDRFSGIAAQPVGWKARLVDAAVRYRVLPFVRESICESIMYEVVRPPT